MRYRDVLLALGGFAAVLAGGPLLADTEDCPAVDPPSGLTLTIKDFGAIDHYVELNWTAWPPGPNYETEHYEFVRWEVQRKTGLSDFAELTASDPGGGVAVDQTNGYALNYVRAPQDCVGTCALPGESYTYRVRAYFKYKPICNQFDGATYPTAFTNEQTIQIPGGNPPTNVTAVAHNKALRTDVRWKAPSPKPDSYRILRSTVSGPKSGAKDAPAAEVVGTAKGDAEAFRDTHVLENAIFSYAVEALSQGKSTISVEDRAYILAKASRKSAFAEPPGIFAGATAAGGRLRLEISSDGSRGFRFWGSKSSMVEADHGIEVSGTLGALAGRPLPLKSVATAVGVFNEDERPDWAKTLAPGDVGNLALRYAKVKDRFDPKAFRVLDGRVAVRHGRLPPADLRFQVEQQNRISQVVPWAKPEIRLFATAAAGKAQAADGDAVVVVYRLVNLGPVPLYARRMKLSASVKNGTVLGGIGAEHFEFLGVTQAGDRQVATWNIGALGPTGEIRSEAATLVLKLRCTFVGQDDYSETSVTFDFDDGPDHNGEESVDAQLADRTVEFLVTPKKGKK